MIFFYVILAVSALQLKMTLAVLNENLVMEQLNFLSEKYKHLEKEFETMKRQLDYVLTDNVLLRERAEECLASCKNNIPHQTSKEGRNHQNDSTVQFNTLLPDEYKRQINDNIKDMAVNTNNSKFARSIMQQEVEIRDRRLLLESAVTPAPTTGKVAFSVSLTSTLSLGEHQTVEYDKVITNIGNGYDVRHGHFTASVKGVYLISCTIMNREGGGAYVEMVQNGSRIAFLYGDSNDFNMGSQTVVVVLDKGDMVWIRHASAGTEVINENGYNTFSGVFLFPI